MERGITNEVNGRKINKSKIFINFMKEPEQQTKGLLDFNVFPPPSPSLIHAAESSVVTRIDDASASESRNIASA